MKTFIVFILVFSLLLVGCEMDRYQIGFSASLSGDNAPFGNDIKKGFQLYIDQVNEMGGVKNKIIQVVVKDDENDLDKVRTVDLEFIQEGIELVVGHDFTSKTEVVLDTIEDERVIFFSPTMSSPSAMNLKDNFFKIMPSVSQHGHALAKYMNKLDRETLIIYDSENENYALSFIESFQEHYNGNTMVLIKDQQVNKELSQIESTIQSNDFDSVVLITNPEDTVTITKYLMRMSYDFNYYSSNWGMTAEAVRSAGPTIDGLIYLSLVNELDSKLYLDFVSAYKQKYNSEPSIGAVYGYEAGMYLIEVLNNSNDLTYEEILKSFESSLMIQGLSTRIRMNEYGDGQRETFIYEVQDGNLILIGGEF